MNGIFMLIFKMEEENYGEGLRLHRQYLNNPKMGAGKNMDIKRPCDVD